MTTLLGGCGEQARPDAGVSASSRDDWQLTSFSEYSADVLSQGYAFDPQKADLDLAAILPNRHYVFPKAPRPTQHPYFTRSEQVLMGTIEAVEPGRATNLRMVTPPGATQEKEVVDTFDFDARDVEQRQALVTLKVTDGFGYVADGSTVVFSVNAPGDVEGTTLVKSLQVTTPVVVLLTRQPGDNTGGYQWGPAMGGHMLGTVSPSGEVSFAGLSDDDKAFLGPLTTIETLRAETAKPVIKIPVTLSE